MTPCRSPRSTGASYYYKVNFSWTSPTPTTQAADHDSTPFLHPSSQTARYLLPPTNSTNSQLPTPLSLHHPSHLLHLLPFFPTNHPSRSTDPPPCLMMITNSQNGTNRILYPIFIIAHHPCPRTLTPYPDPLDLPLFFFHPENPSPNDHANMFVSLTGCTDGLYCFLFVALDLGHAFQSTCFPDSPLQRQTSPHT